MKEKSKKPQKKPFIVNIEMMVPATFKYRVIAESPEEAERNYLKGILIEKHFQLPKAKKIRAKVLDWLSGKVELIKDL